MEKGLYRNLFSHLSSFEISSDVFVPVKYGYSKSSTECNVKVIECFNSFDRFSFFSKQKKTINAIKKNYNLSIYNLIHAHTLFSTGYSAYKINLETGIDYLVAVRNTDVNLFFERFPWFRKIGVRIMKNSKFIIFLSEGYKNKVISDYVPKQFQDEFIKKSVVIPNGIDDFYIANTFKEKHMLHDPLKIIHVGDIDKNKNVTSTLSAIDILKDEGINVEYILIGDIKDNEVGNNVKSKAYTKCLGRKNQSEIITYLRDSDIMVMPSHHETFGIVYGEAISQGVHVIYTKDQGFDGQFKNGTVGFAVNDKDPGNIAESIKNIIANYETLSSNCINNSIKFDWNLIAMKYLELYRECLEKEN